MVQRADTESRTQRCDANVISNIKVMLDGKPEDFTTSDDLDESISVVLTLRDSPRSPIRLPCSDLSNVWKAVSRESRRLNGLRKAKMDLSEVQARIVELENQKEAE